MAVPTPVEPNEDEKWPSHVSRSCRQMEGKTVQDKRTVYVGACAQQPVCTAQRL